MVIDTHAHLNDESFNNDLNNVINNSIKNNISSICIIGWDKDSSIKALEICENYKTIKLYPVCGLHPENVQFEKDKDLKWLETLIIDKKIIAIGEIGIDLHWDKTYLNLQVSFFKKQLELAQKYNLPVIIHNRDAMQITYDILKKYKGVKGILHCYSGSVEMAKELIKLGYKLGIGGIVTYKNCHLPEVIQELDISSFVSETDCPYLPPVPYRGKRNEPSYIINVINKIKEIKNLSDINVEEALYNNAINILNIRE